jgi:hypothetical protein
MSEDARSWLAGLARRGITFTERNGRLRCHPASGYKLLTDDELIFLRHHRPDIKAALKAGGSRSEPPISVAPAAETPVSTPTPAPKCDYCYQSPCVGADHPMFDALHAADPVVVKRRDDRATQEMWLMWAVGDISEWRHW